MPITDDYNYNILGVDKSYQLISYYHPGVRCKSYWMALMFHFLDIIRINGWIICNMDEGGVYRDHKSYILSLSESLMGRASEIKYGRTRSSREVALVKSAIEKVSNWT